MKVEVLKRCRSCGDKKTLDNFRKNAKTRDGLKHECKECDSRRAAEHYQENKKKRIKQASEWQNQHKEEKSIYNKNYYKKTKNQ